MKKLFTLLVLSLLFVGCSDSDDKSNDPAGLVGKWEFLRITVDVNVSDPKAKAEITEWMLDDRDRMGDLEFTHDGKCGEFDAIERRWYWGTYKFDGGKTYTCFVDKIDGESCGVLNYTLKGNSLKITHDETEWQKREYPDAGVKKVIQTVEYTRK